MGNPLEGREYLQRFSSFIVFTGIIYKNITVPFALSYSIAIVLRERVAPFSPDNRFFFSKQTERVPYSVIYCTVPFF